MVPIAVAVCTDFAGLTGISLLATVSVVARFTLVALSGPIYVCIYNHMT